MWPLRTLSLPISVSGLKGLGSTDLNNLKIALTVDNHLDDSSFSEAFCFLFFTSFIKKELECN